MGRLFRLLDFLVDHWDEVKWLVPGVALLVASLSGHWALFSGLPPVVTILIAMAVVTLVMWFATVLPQFLQRQLPRPFTVSVSRIVTGKGEDLSDVVIDVSIINQSSKNRVVLELTPCFRSAEGEERRLQPIDLKNINRGLGPQEHTEGLISFHMGPFSDFMPTEPNKLNIYEIGEDHTSTRSPARGIYLDVVDRISGRGAHFRIPGHYPPNYSATDIQGTRPKFSYLLLPFGLLALIIVGYFFFDPTAPNNSGEPAVSRKQSVTSDPNSSATPSFHFNIRIDQIYFPPGAVPYPVAVAVAVQNLGAPSPATDWKLTVKVGKQEYTGLPFAPIETLGFQLTPGKCFSFRKEDSLTQKTTVSLPPNHIEYGVLMFEFLNIPNAELRREHAVFHLECKDFDRKISHVSIPISETKNSTELPTNLTLESHNCPSHLNNW